MGGLIIAIISIFFASCPLLLVAIVIWSADVYNRKPIWTGIVALLWGAFMATSGALIISSFSQVIFTSLLNFSAEHTENLQTVLIAPTMEEITKGLILLILLFVPRSFESGTNGLVLGAMAGVGFAITENFLYYINTYYTAGAGAWVATIIVRTLFSTFIHVMASGIIGFTLGLGASRGHKPAEMVVLVAIGYILAVAIHMVWNLSATLANVQGGFILVGFLAFFVAAFCVLLLGLCSVFYDRRILQREFEDEIRMGVLTHEDSFVLTRWTRRDALRFVFPGKLSSEFQKTALRLAVIKHQNKCYRKTKRDEEIGRLRNDIVEMKKVTSFYEQEARRNQQQQAHIPGTNPFATAQNNQGYPQANTNTPYGNPNSYEASNAPPIQTVESRSGIKTNPYFGRSDMPQKQPEREDPAVMPTGPHSIRIINPSEFRRKVHKEHDLDVDEDE